MDWKSKGAKECGNWGLERLIGGTADGHRE